MLEGVDAGTHGEHPGEGWGERKDPIRHCTSHFLKERNCSRHPPPSSEGLCLHVFWGFLRGNLGGTFGGSRSTGLQTIQRLPTPQPWERPHYRIINAEPGSPDSMRTHCMTSDHMAPRHRRTSRGSGAPFTVRDQGVSQQSEGKKRINCHRFIGRVCGSGHAYRTCTCAHMCMTVHDWVCRHVGCSVCPGVHPCDI